MPNSVAGIIKKDNLFLLGKRKKGGSIGGKWEFPGGKVEKNETLQESLRREFLEELGVNISVHEFIITEKFKSSDHEFKLHAFFVELLSENIIYNEHDEFKWFKLEDIKTMTNNFADSDKLLLRYL